MAVAVPNPTEVWVPGVAARPEEALPARPGILGSLDGRAIDPLMVLGVPILEAEGADLAMENREGVDPSRRLDVDGPGAHVVAAGISLLDKDHGLGRVGDLKALLIGLDPIPGDAVHAVGLGVAVEGPAPARRELHPGIARAVVHLIARAVLLKGRVAHSIVDPPERLSLRDPGGDRGARAAPVAATEEVHDLVVDAYPSRHQVVLIVVGIENPTEHELLLVAHAIGSGGFHTSTTQSRQ